MLHSFDSCPAFPPLVDLLPTTLFRVEHSSPRLRSMASAVCKMWVCFLYENPPRRVKRNTKSNERVCRLALDHHRRQFECIRNGVEVWCRGHVNVTRCSEPGIFTSGVLRMRPTYSTPGVCIALADVYWYSLPRLEPAFEPNVFGLPPNTHNAHRERFTSIGGNNYRQRYASPSR